MRFAVGVAIAAGALATAGPSAAATLHLGELAPPATIATCAMVPALYVQSQSGVGRPSYEMPVDLVITRWRFNNGPQAGAGRLKIFRRTGSPDVFRVVGESALETLAANTLSSFTTSVPARAGDLIGAHFEDSTNCLFFTSPVADELRSGATANPAVGSDAAAPSGLLSARLNVDVLAEPDNDADGSPDDSVDTDDDNDGFVDGGDNCPLIVNADQRNTDAAGDGGDACDADDDNDGARDDADNCATVTNADQADADLGGSGDACDEDDDNDGLSDSEESARRTSPVDVDSDDDGLGDAAERRTNPARADTDGDGLPDGLELGRQSGVADPAGTAAGTDPARFRADRDPRSRTDPLKRDTDGDRIRDGREDRNRNGRRDSRETNPRRLDTDRDQVDDKRDRHPLDRRRR